MNHHQPPDLFESDDGVAADRRILHRLIDTLPDGRIPLVTGLLLRYAARILPAGQLAEALRRVLSSVSRPGEN
ncbi:MAG TPA: hypothetical protein VMZ31_04470 [Phycisphaerae bacterium]|nr:hypothetical protein [Phycisphaerae bacterium]